jgi:hypothetical protein
LPVFIVGMSRSGTILVEQIAVSRPAVFSSGERDDLGAIAGQHSPDGATELDPTLEGALAQTNLEIMRDSVGSALRMTDKAQEPRAMGC